MVENQKSLDARGNKVHMVGRHVVLLLNLTMFTFLLSDSLVARYHLTILQTLNAKCDLSLQGPCMCWNSKIESCKVPTTLIGWHMLYRTTVARVRID